MGVRKLSICAAAAVALLATGVQASEAKQKLKGSMQVVYLKVPGSVDSLSEMFTKGMFYGRLRSNMFLWDWKEEKAGKRKDNHAWGLGGSLIYKSAKYNGLSMTMGLYTSQNPAFASMDKKDVGLVKAGKDTFSRNRIRYGGKDEYTGSWGMSVLGQAYLEYAIAKTNLKVGRQLFESVFTKSNDTKMIPNTFDGVVLENKDIAATKLRAAYFTKQKLRDHTSAHDLVTFKTADGNSWGNNDDSAVHKGLSYNNFLAHNKDPNHEMILVDANTKYVKNLNATLSYLTVPGVVQDVVLEAHYKIPMENGWAIRPGFRYFQQIDDGGGKVAGYTNLKGKEAIGYDAGVADSLDSSLINARVDALMPGKKGFFRFGFSHVADKADIVAPWRGFPTGGFTRAMAQYNWYANTRTYMVRGAYKFNKYFNSSLRVAYQDFDDDKPNVQADSTVLHLDNISKLADNLEMKVRVGLVSCDTGNTGKSDTSYNEYRLEFNYLF
jgi:hypothetical protein